MTWTDAVTAWYRLREWAICFWQDLNGNCQCEFCELGKKWRQTMDKAQQERVAELQREAREDYQSNGGELARENFDRRARDRYRDELKDDE